MSALSSVQESRRRELGPFGGGPRKNLSREDAANRITAFVYGNILVITALVALHPQDLDGPKGVAYVVGTALSTFVAHVIAESVGLRVRTDIRPQRSTVVHELRNAVPILSSATLPALLMITVLAGVGGHRHGPAADHRRHCRAFGRAGVGPRPPPQGKGLVADVPVRDPSGRGVRGRRRPEMVAHPLSPGPKEAVLRATAGSGRRAAACTVTGWRWLLPR